MFSSVSSNFFYPLETTGYKKAIPLKNGIVSNESFYVLKKLVPLKNGIVSNESFYVLKKLVPLRTE